MQKKETRPISLTYTKRSQNGPKAKCSTGNMRLLEENPGQMIQDMGLGKEFWI
jgi:hypothetical protein